MSKKGYEIFDIVILTIIACIIEGVLTYTSNLDIFMAEGFTVSFMIVFALIGIFRWNLKGVIPGVGSCITAIVIQNYFSQTSVDLKGYSTGMIIGSICGMVSLLLMVLFFKFKDKKTIKSFVGYLFLYCGAAFILYILVYSVIWSIIDKVNLIETLFNLIQWNILNYIMSTIVLIIANKQKDFLVDMNEYLIYLHTVPDSIRLRKEINEDDKSSLMNEVNDSDEINDIALLDGGTLSEEQLIELNKTFKEKEGENYGTRKS